ncbi:MAG: DUF3106 domain-containing protein [Bryobacteraceae bacterium]
MSRALQVGAVLWLAMASSLFGQKAPKPAPARPPRAAPAHPNAPPKGALKAGGGRILNPGNPVLRMMAMPPERREQMLERLPPQQQVRLRQALENFDRLPPAERSRQLGILNMYANLPPEKQAALTKQIQLFNHLPDDRIAVLRPELVKLHRMSESERSDRMASEEFRSKFPPAEQQMLAEISPYFPFTGR